MMRIDADFFEKGTRTPQGGARMTRIIADFFENGTRTPRGGAQMTRIDADFLWGDGGFIMDIVGLVVVGKDIVLINWVHYKTILKFTSLGIYT